VENHALTRLESIRIARAWNWSTHLIWFSLHNDKLSSKSSKITSLTRMVHAN